MSGERITPSSHLLKRIFGAVGETALNSERLIPEYFEFFPLGNDLILKELKFVVEKCFLAPDHRNRFLDVGCGPGNVMAIAESLGFVPFGIEYNPSLVKRAPYRQLKQSSLDNGPGIYQQDAFKFVRYGDFDAVYLYCPVFNFSLEVKLENLIETHLKKGAIYIANTKQDKSITKNPNFEFIGEEKKLPIWRKVK